MTVYVCENCRKASFDNFTCPTCGRAGSPVKQDVQEIDRILSYGPSYDLRQALESMKRSLQEKER